MGTKIHPIVVLTDSTDHQVIFGRLLTQIKHFKDNNPSIDILSISHSVGIKDGSAIITYKEPDIAIKDDGD